MQYIGSALLSVFLLIQLIAKDEAMLSVRKRVHNENPKEHRKMRFTITLILWAVVTVGWFIYLIFFS